MPGRYVIAKRMWRVATLLLGLTPQSGAAQGSPCTPVDSARIVAWHQEWDHTDPAQNEFAHGDSGTIELAALMGAVVRPAQVTGRFALTVAMLVPAAPDQVRTFMLELWRPSGAARRAMERDPDWFPHAMALRGRMIRTDTTADDTMPLIGALRRHQWFGFGPVDDFGAEDGEGYEVTEVTGSGFRGWYGDGALAPTPLGYFCAERIG
jgi:hypothetical protein